ncbi:MAG TPA: type VI secretion system tube protein TssD [Hymenobacter sp.]|uniref:type VI secretion system tube protein TssD n=1 Tax=Hymenobacter sp. TaxID=1898978 RepID=UPI002D7FE81E|nr:type VI secretion system tube protein TssD [Hymenobacter sp.]HET9505140.1 type VI secretion system tube protein TssD [Hymenobacter sp.]
MSSFRGMLLLAGQEFPLVQCSYEFGQATSERGRVVAKVRSGLLVLHLDVPDGDQLLAWANDPHKKLSGSVVFHQTDRPVVREELTFEDGFCVAYEENFSSGAAPEGAYRCTLHISAARLALGAVAKDNTWVQTR